jgi:hypothetical protein
MAIEKLSIYDNVAMIHEHSGAKRSSRRADVLAAIEFVGLEASPKAKVGVLGARERRTRRGRPRRRRPTQARACSTSPRRVCRRRRPATSAR